MTIGQAITHKLTFGSLFAGMGGFDLGFERAGMICGWQVEIDDKCNRVLDHHWPDVRRHGDVRETGKHNLEPVDVICGGFPCQDLSIAGKREGLAGKRSGLWFEFRRVLAELRPRWAIVENVPGLLSSNEGRDFAIILQGLAEIGYLSSWRVLDAQYYRVAQRRRRVFLVSSLGDGSCAEILFEPESLSWDSAPSREAGAQSSSNPEKRLMAGGAVAFDWTADGSKDKSWGGKPRSWIVKRGDYAGALATTKVQAVARPLAFGSTIDHYDESQQTYIPVTANTLGNHHGRNDQDSMGAYIVFEPGNLVRRCGANPTTEVAPTLGAEKPGDTFPHIAYNWQSGGDVRLSFGLPNLQANQVPAVGVRRLTPTECERLQGFPDGWTAVNGMSDSARYRMLGNAVAVPAAEWIGRKIVAASHA